MKIFFDKLNNFYIALILLFAIFALHADVILAPVGYYFSGFDLKDLNYYINIRQYVVDSLSAKSFPLWTAKMFCGVPFFANSETAVFYFPNIMFFLMSVSKALNFSFLIHFFILSFSVFLWINNKIKDKAVSLFTAVISVFAGSIYFHACAGHLSNVITMVWFPLLLYFYDKSFQKQTYNFIIPAAVVISLQMFAGHYQYAYYTALISFIYVLFFCRDKKTLITLFLSYAIALCLSAIQFLPSIEFYIEGTRKTGILQHFFVLSKASHLITLLFPEYTYYTGAYFWETAVYIGLFNILIILSALFNKYDKNIIKNATLVFVIYLLSYHYAVAEKVIPFFDNFRSHIKINFFTTVLLFPILARGVCQILSKNIKINRYFILLLLLSSLMIIVFKNDISQSILYLFTEKFTINNALEQSVFVSGVLIFIFSISMFFKQFISVKIFLILLALIQPVLFAKSYSKPFFFNTDYNYGKSMPDSINEDTRFLSNDRYNLHYSGENVSGSAPDILNDYMQFMKHFENPNINVNMDNIFGLLRCKSIVNDKTGEIYEYEYKTLKRVNFFYHYITQSDKTKIYEILSDKNFNIFNTVILEKEPKYSLSDKEGEYYLKILSLNDNSIEIEYTTTEPAIILFTDNYEKNWKACDVETGEKYEIIPADYIYKAISTDKGKHKIRLEYKSVSFVAGAWISLISWVVLLCFVILLLYRNNKLYFFCCVKKR